MIAVHATKRGERLARIARHVEIQSKRIDGVFIAGINADLPEDPPISTGVAEHEFVVLGDFAPRLTLVVGAVHLG